MKRIAIRIVSAVLLIVVLLGVAVSIAGMVYRPQAAIPSGFAGSYVDVAGIPLRVVQEGSGRDILMIHGSPGILEDFDAQARDLRTSFRVTRYDRPGQGFSGDTGNYSIRDNARVALALIEKLGLTNTIVVGHSYGGATALALGEMKSPRVAALVILDSAAYTSIRAVSPRAHLLGAEGRSCHGQRALGFDGGACAAQPALRRDRRPRVHRRATRRRCTQRAGRTASARSGAREPHARLTE